MKWSEVHEALEVAKGAAVAAGEKIMEFYQKESTVQYKSDSSPVTAADQAANNIITQTLTNYFPQHAILSEESQDDGRRLENDWCWIIDPLDGTKEFIHGNGEFTVNIALTFRHRVVLGVIAVPVSKELYYAVQGEGAYVEKNGQVEKLQVSARRENLRLVMSRSHPSERLDELIRKNQISEVKRAGSSLKGCLVASGDAELYYRFNPTMEWDTAAMQCIVEEAGGVFRQMDDAELLYNRSNSRNDKGFYVLNQMENKMQ